MLNELLPVKEIFNILTALGLPKTDLNFWKGTVNFDLAACQALAQYLRTATGDEVKNFNELLKQKISVFKSGDKNVLRALISRERQLIFQ